MSWVAKLGKGEGRSGPAKRTAKAALSFHLPVNGSHDPSSAVLPRACVCARGVIWAWRFFLDRAVVPQPVRLGRVAVPDGGTPLRHRDRANRRGRLASDCREAVVRVRTVRTGGLPELVIGDDTFIAHACSFSVGRSVRIGRQLSARGRRRRLRQLTDIARRSARRPATRPRRCDRPGGHRDDVWTERVAYPQGVTIATVPSSRALGGDEDFRRTRSSPATRAGGAVTRLGRRSSPEYR